ncbi:MAG: hypothetical protein K6U80_13245 [Firmicutes bacterium]|nr:hypothetical protein [Bacillota bacterium]
MSVDITMLGVSNTGKTCFMTAMYSIMCMGVNGFSLACRDHQQRIMLNANWQSLVRKRGDDRWMASATAISRWSFNCCYAYRPIIGIDMLDYRGGLLESDSNESLEEYDQLLGYFNNSACIFIMIPANRLHSGLKDYKDPSSIVNAINPVLTKYRESTGGRTCPISVIITKSDYLMAKNDSSKTKENFDFAIKNLKNYISPLFVADWPLFICPVTLGKELAIDKNQGAIQPINIHLPVLYAISLLLKKTIEQKRSELKTQIEEGQTARAQQSNYESGSRIRRWWYSSEAAASKEKADEIFKEVNNIKEEVNKMERDFQLSLNQLAQGKNCYFHLGSSEPISIEEFFKR